MNSFRIWASLILVVAAAGCSKGYVLKDKKWHYKDWNASWGVYYDELQGVDAATFKVRQDGLGSDKNGVWYKATRVDADSATFESIAGPFYRDKNHVFYRGSGLRKVKGADPNSFKHLGGEYAKDARAAYFQWRSVAGADVPTFTPTSDYYATDKSHVWYRGLLISQPRPFSKKTIRAVDRESFEDLQSGEARDKHGSISFGRPAE